MLGKLRELPDSLDSELNDRLSFRGNVKLMILGGMQLAVVVWLAFLSKSFAYDTDPLSRPILGMVGLWSVAFALSMVSLYLALHARDTRKLLGIIFGFALAMRSILLFSEPIQEVDIYRYIWDGAVSSHGINPYAFSPQSFRASENHSADVRALSRKLDDDLGLAEVHRRVHFPEFTTVYPPTSQVIFATAYRMTFKSAMVEDYVWTMKMFIIVFDVGVLILLSSLLQFTGKHSGWAIAYGWSPLVLKEFANSGHLDSIAVFWMFAAIGCLVRVPKARASSQASSFWHPRVIASAGLWSAVFLGFGVGAKLFPVILSPLFACYVLTRSGLRGLAVWLITFAIVTTATLAPMLLAEHATPNQDSGLTTFLQYWEMNDLLFMVLQENIRPEGSIEGQPALWFVVVPNAIRMTITEFVASKLLVDVDRVPFFVTRVLTTLGFGILLLLLSRTTYKNPDRLVECVFLAVAWFWFLSPTQNPWYWTWAVPLVPFARSRVWLFVSGVAVVYYLRFWTEYHVPETRFMDQSYIGTAVFDFLIVWLEFAPVLLLLAFAVTIRLFFAISLPEKRLLR